MQRQLLNIAFCRRFRVCRRQRAGSRLPPAAVGEFSAADAQTTVSAPALTCNQVREETAAVRSQLQTVNSEIGVQPEHVQSAKNLRRCAPGRLPAIRAGKVASGELNM